VGGHGSQDFDFARDQLGAQQVELLLLEVMLRRDGLQGRLFDRAPLLGFVEERLEGIKQSRQFSSRPFVEIERGDPASNLRSHCPH
jgi:hypothetical protein